MFELIVVVLIVYFIFKLFRGGSKNTEDSCQISEVSMDDPAVAALIDEAIMVINDMLEVGRPALMYSERDYEGLIIAVADARPPFKGNYIDYGFHIRMHNISDLSLCRSSLGSTVDSFIRRYSHCYSSSDRGYVYKTNLTVRIHNDNRGALRTLLYKQVELRCPLADFSNGHLHTKGVAYY